LSKVDHKKRGIALVQSEGAKGAREKEDHTMMTTTKKTTKSKSTSTSSASTTAPVAQPAQATPPPASPPAAAPTDPNAALALFAQQTVAQFDTIEANLGGDPPLSPAQKRHAAKLRKGGAAIIAQIGNLASQEQLESPALQVSSMTAALGKAQALQPLADRVTAFMKHIDDVIFTAESAAIVEAQQFYALLQRRALTDTELKAALAPVVTFFARKPKPKVAGALTKLQTKATKKAVKTVTKNAPQLLQGGAEVGVASAPTAGTSASASPVNGGAVAASGGSAATAANGASHS
jgi:hypothetical protein